MPAAKKDPKNKRLTDQQKAAVMAMANPECKSLTQAVMVAYPKSHNWSLKARQNFASALFQKPHVAYALEVEREKMALKLRTRSALTAERIIDEFQLIALAKITDVVQYETKEGPRGVKIYIMKVTEFEKLTEDTKAAIKKIKIRSLPQKDENGETEHVIQEVEFEMYDKQRALDGLAKHFNLFVERVEHHHSGTVGHVHTTAQELRELFNAMTPDERSGHLAELMSKMGEIPE